MRCLWCLIQMLNREGMSLTESWSLVITCFSIAILLFGAPRSNLLSRVLVLKLNFVLLPMSYVKLCGFSLFFMKWASRFNHHLSFGVTIPMLLPCHKIQSIIRKWNMWRFTWAIVSCISPTYIASGEFLLVFNSIQFVLISFIVSSTCFIPSDVLVCSILVHRDQLLFFQVHGSVILSHFVSHIVHASVFSPKLLPMHIWVPLTGSFLCS